jgi:hypothetical protein
MIHHIHFILYRYIKLKDILQINKKKNCGILSTLAALTYRCSVGANQVERTKIRKKMSAKI